MERIAVELLSSLATVAFAILAVIVFIYYGAGAMFYATVVVALIVGFYNAWLISKSESASGAKEQPAAVAVQKAAVNVHAMGGRRSRPARKARAKA